MGLFGWSYPPGCSGPPEEYNDDSCACCGAAVQISNLSTPKMDHYRIISSMDSARRLAMSTTPLTAKDL